MKFLNVQQIALSNTEFQIMHGKLQIVFRFRMKFHFIALFSTPLLVTMKAADLNDEVAWSPRITSADQCRRPLSLFSGSPLLVPALISAMMIHLSDLSPRPTPTAAAAALTSTGDANVTGGQTSETPLDLCLTRKVRRKRSEEGRRRRKS